MSFRGPGGRPWPTLRPGQPALVVLNGNPRRPGSGGRSRSTPWGRRERPPGRAAQRGPALRHPPGLPVARLDVRRPHRDVRPPAARGRPVASYPVRLDDERGLGRGAMTEPEERGNGPLRLPPPRWVGEGGGGGGREVPNSLDARPRAASASPGGSPGPASCWASGSPSRWWTTRGTWWRAIAWMARSGSRPRSPEAKANAAAAFRTTTVDLEERVLRSQDAVRRQRRQPSANYRFVFGEEFPTDRRGGQSSWGRSASAARSRPSTTTPSLAPPPASSARGPCLAHRPPERARRADMKRAPAAVRRVWAGRPEASSRRESPRIPSAGRDRARRYDRSRGSAPSGGTVEARDGYRILRGSLAPAGPEAARAASPRPSARPSCSVSAFPRRSTSWTAPIPGSSPDSCTWARAPAWACTACCAGAGRM